MDHATYYLQVTPVAGLCSNASEFVWGALEAATSTWEYALGSVTLHAVVLNDRTKTELNPYEHILGPAGVIQLLISRRSIFQLDARTRFLRRHRRSLWYLCKICVFGYARMLALVVARWILLDGAFQRAGKKWRARLERK